MQEPTKVEYIKPLPISIGRAISAKDKYHNPAKTITYSFMGGSGEQNQHTRLGIRKILDVAPGLKLKEVTSDGDIRITFNPNLGSWSYVGTDIYLIPKTQPTMNLGWMESTYRVVVHEFGHSLNLSHEHIRGINWDKPKVYEYFSRIGWDKADVDNNLFYFDEEGFDTTPLDVESIMLYSFPCSLTLDGKNCGRSNTKLSPTDIEALNRMFPFDIDTETPTTSPPEPPQPPMEECFKLAIQKVFGAKSELHRLYERQVVIIATALGLEADERPDLKADTIDRIWQELNKT